MTLRTLFLTAVLCLAAPAAFARGPGAKRVELARTQVAGKSPVPTTLLTKLRAAQVACDRGSKPAACKTFRALHEERRTLLRTHQSQRGLKRANRK